MRFWIYNSTPTLPKLRPRARNSQSRLDRDKTMFELSVEFRSWNSMCTSESGMGGPDKYATFSTVYLSVYLWVLGSSGAYVDPRNLRFPAPISASSVSVAPHSDNNMSSSNSDISFPSLQTSPRMGGPDYRDVREQFQKAVNLSREAANAEAQSDFVHAREIYTKAAALLLQARWVTQHMCINFCINWCSNPVLHMYAQKKDKRDNTQSSFLCKRCSTCCHFIIPKDAYRRGAIVAQNIQRGFSFQLTRSLSCSTASPSRSVAVFFLSVSEKEVWSLLFL